MTVGEITRLAKRICVDVVVGRLLVYVPSRRVYVVDNKSRLVSMCV